MKIITDTITVAELSEMATAKLGNLVKAVVDIEQGLLAVDAGLHSDLEWLLLENGSSQSALWGINLFPTLSGREMIEYDSMINVRPQDGNRTRGVDDPSVRQAIIEVVLRRVSA
jgi:hypothetical protein